MHKLSLFLSEKKLPPKLQVRVIREVGALYRRSVVQNHNWVYLMEDMSPQLQKDIIAYSMKDMLTISSFVRHVNNDDFHTELFSSCEELYLQPGRYLGTSGFSSDYW
jgi:hypothetical protein